MDTRATLVWFILKSSTCGVLWQQFMKCLVTNLDWSAIKVIPGYKLGPGWQALKWQ